MNSCDDVIIIGNDVVNLISATKFSLTIPTRETNLAQIPWIQVLVTTERTWSNQTMTPNFPAWASFLCPRILPRV